MSEFDTHSQKGAPFAGAARDDESFVRKLNDLSVCGFVDVDTINERPDGSIFFAGWIVREGPTEIAKPEGWQFFVKK